MLDPVLLRQFKSLTREDEQIADIILREVGHIKAKRILDVGAGRGTVSERIVAAMGGDVERHVIEPQLGYTYPPSVMVFRAPWEAEKPPFQYDLILMSHVIGHFPEYGRGNIVTQAVDLLRHHGNLVIVENAPHEPFWSINLHLASLQGTQYVIDFQELERALLSSTCTVDVREHLIPLYLGSNRREQLTNFNVLFPREFTHEEERIVTERWSELIPADDGILSLMQRIYCVRQQ